MPAGLIERETTEFLGRPDVRYRCAGCGHVTDAYPLDAELLAAGDMNEHLADAHGPELGIGRCANCHEPTDDLRIESGELGTAWLCSDCAPTPEGLTP